MSGFRGSVLQGINLTKAQGDKTGNKAILWNYNQHISYTHCTLLMDGKLCFLRTKNGELTCLDAKTGKLFDSKEKLEGIGNLYSSPSGVGEWIYIAAESICIVIKAGKKFEIISSNELGKNLHTSPVIVDNELILRGFESLYCFSRN